MQAKLVKVPPQVPLKISITASDKVPGVTVMICEVAVATKVYHASSSAVPWQLACDCVADTVVPDLVAVQVSVGLMVKAIAPPQLSFAKPAAVVALPLKAPKVL